MTKFIEKLVIGIIFAIIVICIASISKSVMLDGSWDVSGNGYVTEFDFALKTRSLDWYTFDPFGVVGREVYMNAGVYTEGGRVTINQAGAYCIGHGNTSWNAYGQYKITNIIDIDIGGSNPGTVQSYLENGQVITVSNPGINEAAIKTAYAAYKGKDVQYVGSSYMTNWKYLTFRFWASDLDSFINNYQLYSVYKEHTSSLTYPNNDQGREATNYYDSILRYKFENTTSGTPRINNVNGTAYLGPYRINTAEGTINGAQAPGYTVLGYSTSVGGAISDISGIPNNQDFYIVIQGSVSSKVTVTLTKALDVVKARLLFVYNGTLGDGAQHIMMFRGDLETRTYALELTPTEEPYTNLKLIKMDAETAALLPNVQFRFKYNGQYYTTRGTFTSNVNDSTIFTTNANGEIILNNIPVGTWTYEEVANNNSGYEQCIVNPPSGTQNNVVSYATMEGIERAKMITRSIYESQEGINARAKLSNTDFVKVAYRCVLGREADAGGLSSWVNMLNQGRNSTSEMQVIAGLYDSAEFKNYYKDNDSWRITYSTNLYKNLLGRNPNPNSEVGYWVAIMQGYFPLTIYNKKVVGNIYITKRDQDTNAGLPNVGFRFQNVSTGKYVRSSGGTISYVDGAGSATEFKTDGSGNLTVKGVLLGQYRVYETSNPNPGYIINTSPTTVTTNTSSYQRINNTYYYGNLQIRKYDQDTNANLPNVEFTVKATSGQANGKYLYLNSNGTVGYSSSRVTVKTNTNGLITLNNIWIGNYEIIEVSNPNYGYLVNSTPNVVTVNKRQTTTKTVPNEYQLGNLQVLKIDADNDSIKLPNVEFTVRAISGQKNGQYVYLDSSGNVAYSTSRATVKTNSQGLITLNSLWVGNYEIIEVSNPNYSYVVDSTVRTVTITKRNTTNLTIKNKKVYVKVSGYVWEDGPLGGKETERNDLYRNDVNDSNDKLLGNITVRLKEGNTVVKETKTASNGSYIFIDVLIDKLPNYYIEFEYDGLKYENVIVHNDKTNGSKASEGSARDTLNNKFAKVENGGTKDQVAVKDASNKTQYTIKYTLDPSTASAQVTDSSSCKITSTTTNANYKLTYDRASTETEIKNINLGVYLRTQADLAIMQDLDNVKVEVAGYGHIYKYANRFENASSDEDDYYIENAWNVGVRFQSEYSSLSYTRPVYKADAYYGKDTENPIPASEELKVSLTYKIAIRNEETIAGRVNQVVDYFDSRYEIEGIGTQIDDNTGTIQNPLNYTLDPNTYQNGKYKKVLINTNILVDKSISNKEEQDKNNTQKYVYIQFTLDDDAVIDLLDDAENTNAQRLENIAEITSYTSYYDLASQKLYAAVDKDAVVENSTPGDKTTYEDDTDTAPTIALTVSEAREVSGRVFEDNAEEELLEENNLRQGNGKYDSGEAAIGNVKVELMEVDEQGNVTENVARVFNDESNQWEDSLCQTEVDSNGEYTIDGFAPGKYVIKYTWGDGTYKIVDGQRQEYTDMVENYKATNIDENMNRQENENQKFYTKVADADEEPYLNKELSHALDNYGTREEIDTQLDQNTVTDDNKGYNYTTTVNINEMTSVTPIMNFTVEFNDEINDDGKIPTEYSRLSDLIKFEAKNMSFGIIRRPIQSFKVTKTLEKVKLTLANGQVLIDAYLNEDGTIGGEKQFISYTPPVVTDGKITHGTWRAEIDEELIQGAKVDMTYKFTTENTGETDYKSQGFYNFGENYYTSRANEESAKLADIIGISPSTMIDYLDEESILKVESQINEQYGWQAYTIPNLRDSKLVDQAIVTRLQNGTDANGEALNPVQIYVTNYYKDNGIYVKPAYSISTNSSGIVPLEKSNVYMETEKVLSSTEDSNFINQLEIVIVSKPGGSKIIENIPGNYTPNETDQEEDDTVSEELIITPNTGENRNFIVPITVLIITFIIIGIGTYLIVVKIMRKEFK